MVRMLGIRSISLSHLYDNGIRLTHLPGYRAKREVNGVERVWNQPALTDSHDMGSTSPPLIQTSKWRWFAVERPVLPT